MSRLYDILDKMSAKIEATGGTITAGSNWTSGTLQYVETAGMVIVNIIDVRRSTATGGDYLIVGTLPTGFRPNAFTRGFCFQQSASALSAAGCYVQTDGGVYITSSNVAPTFGVFGQIAYVRTGA